MNKNLQDRIVKQVILQAQKRIQQKALQVRWEDAMEDYLRVSHLSEKHEEYNRLLQHEDKLVDNNDHLSRFCALREELEQRYESQNPKDFIEYRTMTLEKKSPLDEFTSKIKNFIKEDKNPKRLLELSKSELHFDDVKNILFETLNESPNDAFFSFLFIYSATDSVLRSLMLELITSAESHYDRSFVENIPKDIVLESIIIETSSQYQIQDYQIIIQSGNMVFQEIFQLLGVLLRSSPKEIGDFFDWVVALHFWKLNRCSFDDFQNFAQTISSLCEKKKIKESSVPDLLRYVCDMYSIQQVSSLQIEMIRCLRGKSAIFEELIRNLEATWSGIK